MRLSNTFFFLELKSKLIEIDTLRESLCRQVDHLQQQFEKQIPPKTGTRFIIFCYLIKVIIQMFYYLNVSQMVKKNRWLTLKLMY